MHVQPWLWYCAITLVAWGVVGLLQKPPAVSRLSSRRPYLWPQARLCPFRKLKTHRSINGHYRSRKDSIGEMVCIRARAGDPLGRVPKKPQDQRRASVPANFARPQMPFSAASKPNSFTAFTARLKSCRKGRKTNEFFFNELQTQDTRASSYSSPSRLYPDCSSQY